MPNLAPLPCSAQSLIRPVQWFPTQPVIITPDPDKFRAPGNDEWPGRISRRVPPGWTLQHQGKCGGLQAGKARTGIVLAATQVIALNYSLEPGAQETTVEVTAEAPLVNIGNSVLGRTIDNREVDNLPLVNRDAYQLLSLTPGVQQLQQENSIGVPMEHVIINGASDNMVGQVTYYLDGGLNMTGVRNTGNVIPNPDAIDQFAVETNNFSAQYGRTGAGVVSVLTKSGTNQFHGSVFYFNQETNFNSNAWGQTTRSPLPPEPLWSNRGRTCSQGQDIFLCRLRRPARDQSSAVQHRSTGRVATPRKFF